MENGLRWPQHTGARTYRPRGRRQAASSAAHALLLPPDSRLLEVREVGQNFRAANLLPALATLSRQGSTSRKRPAEAKQVLCGPAACRCICPRASAASRCLCLQCEQFSFSLEGFLSDHLVDTGPSSVSLSSLLCSAVPPAPAAVARRCLAGPRCTTRMNVVAFADFLCIAVMVCYCGWLLQRWTGC
jgi:hypothetical protein